jgi:hypothetical protein
MKDDSKWPISPKPSNNTEPNEEPNEEPTEEPKEKKKCRLCGQRHSGPTPFCPRGPA